MRREMLGTIAVLWLCGPAAAQDVDLMGQIRPRFEVRDPVPGTGTLEFTSMRTRLSVSAAVAEGVTGFVQLQDVRVFGEETSTLIDYSADGLDIHQAWAELGDPAQGRWALRIGRQEAAYGGERLVGAVNWTQQGRAFDGARVRYRPVDGFQVDGLAFRLSDADALRAGGDPAADYSLYGLYSVLEAAGVLDIYALNDRLDGVTSRDRYTVGARWVSDRDDLSWRLEGAYQLGTREDAVDTDISSFMLGARLGTSLGEDLRATLWYDYLSGDSDPADGTYKAFDTLFATNHKFYGYLDLFLDIPATTQDRGLQDIAVKTRYDVRSDQALSADLHLFRLADAARLETARLGEELDVTYRWGYAPGVGLSGGFSYFQPADGWTQLGNPDERMVWGYLMMDVTF